MLALSFFSWWYGPGWRQVFRNFGPRLERIASAFSVRQLIRTLFAPWRRIITYPGASLAERFHAGIDNLISRVIGFLVRLLVLFTAAIALSLGAVLTVLEIAAWPLLPLAIPGLLIAGLVV